MINFFTLWCELEFIENSCKNNSSGNLGIVNDTDFTLSHDHDIMRDQNISLRRQPTALRLKSISQLLIALICMCAAETYTILIVFGYPLRRWQAPGAVKKENKNQKKIRKKIKKIVPVPIYVFVNSEQKAEFKAKIKPCYHQLNCMQFLL